MSLRVESVTVHRFDGSSHKADCRISKSPVGNGAHVLSFQCGAEDTSKPAKVEIVFRIPVAGIHGFWTPLRSSGVGNQVSLSWSHEMHTSAGNVFPVVILVDRELQPKLFLSLMEHATETHWRLDLSQSDECYFIRFTYPDSGYLAQDAWDKLDFYVEESESVEGDVFDSIYRFVEHHDGWSGGVAGKSTTPDSAYDPIFCTWYAAHAAMDRQWVERTAGVARELGFGQFIQDDGWQYDRYGRVTSMSELTDWFARSGDWTPSTKKFPGFAEHVAHLQSLGLKYILWWDPYGVGRLSQTFESLHSRLASQEMEPEGRYCLCAQDDVVRRHIVDTAKRMVADYGVDGFKVDYLYSISKDICTNPDHQHFLPTPGHAMVRTMRETLEAVLAIKPKFNMVHVGGPVFNRLSTSLRGIDVPFDADTNLYFLAYLNAFSGSVPLQSDPLFWSQEDSPSDIARHLISSMFFVPCLSMDLLSLPAEHLDTIRRWMGFYRDNKDFLRTADRRIEHVGPLVAGLCARSNARQIIGAFRNAPIRIREAEETIILNGSSSKDIYLVPDKNHKFNAEFFGPDFQRLRGGVLEIDGIAKVEIPCGGYARLISE